MDAREILKTQHEAEAAYIRARAAKRGPLWEREKPRLVARCRALLEQYTAADGDPAESPLNGLAAELDHSDPVPSPLSARGDGTGVGSGTEAGESRRKRR